MVRIYHENYKKESQTGEDTDQLFSMLGDGCGSDMFLRQSLRPPSRIFARLVTCIITGLYRFIIASF